MSAIAKNIIDHFPGVILHFDLNSKKINYFKGTKRSSLFADLSTKENLCLDDLRAYVSEKDRERVLNKTTDCMLANKDWCIEYQVVSDNGTKWLREQSYLTKENDTHSPTIGLFIDEITESCIEKQKIIQQLDEANESANMKNEFFASMSHEIRTPMNAVMGMAQILAKNTLNVEQKQYVNTIIASSNALVQIINDILDLSKLEVGKVEIVEEEVDLEFLCLEVCHLLSTRIQNKNLQIYLDFGVGSEKLVHVDKGRLRQVLINLIGNAVKFTESGSVELVIKRIEPSIQNNPSKPLFEFSIIDSGIGISDKAKKKLFRAYSQANEKISQEFGGTGLGLQICQHLVSLMGGTIGVNSNLVRGSTFWFTLPLTFTKSQDVQKFHDKSCFIHDMDPLSKKHIVKITQEMALDISWAETTGSAYNMIKKSKSVDYFIVDHAAKHFDGLAFCEKIRSYEQHCHSTIILLTSIGKQMDPFTLFESGVDVYLSKPVSPSLVYKALNTVDAKSKSSGRAIYISNELLGQGGEVLEIIKVKAGGKVLIVEDVEVNQVILTSMLSQFGLQVDVASNGEEALELISEFEYEMIFMDCRMPIMDGFVATKRIRDMGGSKSKVPIVALTANVGVEDKQICIEAGMTDYLAKPYTEKELAKVICQWMETVTVQQPSSSSASSDSLDNEILDLSQFDSIKSSLSHEFASFVLEITDKFIIYQQDIIRALKNGDMDKVYEKAHSLKGVAAMIGAKQISEIASAIETAGQEKNLETAIINLSKLDAAISKTHSMIIISLNPEIDKSLLLF